MAGFVVSMQKPYFCNVYATVRDRIRKRVWRQYLKNLRPFTNHIYKYAFVWQCMIVVDYMYLAICLIFLFSACLD